MVKLFANAAEGKETTMACAGTLPESAYYEDLAPMEEEEIQERKDPRRKRTRNRKKIKSEKIKRRGGN